MNLTLAAWITFGVIALTSTILMRAMVRFFAKKADNGWDNAIAYTLVTVLLAIPVRWMFQSDSYILTLLIPGLCWAVQTIALRVIYEVKTLHAWTLGVLHALISTTVIGGMSLAAGLVAAYLLYGKIISDPMFLIRLILRLIGIEL